MSREYVAIMHAEFLNKMKEHMSPKEVEKANNMKIHYNVAENTKKRAISYIHSFYYLHTVLDTHGVKS